MAERGSLSGIISGGLVWSNGRLEMARTRPHRVPQLGKIIDAGLPSTAAIEVDSPSEASKQTVSQVIDVGLPSEASRRQPAPRTPVNDRSSKEVINTGLSGGRGR